MQETSAAERRACPPRIQRSLQQGEGAEHVGLQEALRITDRPVDMRLRSQMRHARELVLFEQPLHQRRITNVAIDELDAAVGNQRLEASYVGRIGHCVDHHQPIRRSRGAPCMREVLPDEAGAARD